jgi:hypothetical protein
MCRGVQFEDGRRADTVGELRAIVGEVFVALRPVTPPDFIRPGECLCSVDMEKTARRAGATVDQYADPFDWTWRQNEDHS